jgi:hypothetical protein
MVESEFGVKAAQFHALAAELAAAFPADTSGVLAVEVLADVFGAGRLCSHHHHQVHEGGRIHVVVATPVAVCADASS